MREHFSADWAFGIRGAIENVVRRTFPSELKLWPLLQSFNFEAYSVDDSYFVMVLRDKLSGVPSGPSVLNPFPIRPHPSLPLSSGNVVEWLSFLVEKFALRTEDVAMILPIHDSDINDASADFNLFSEQEKKLWDYQLEFFINRQKSALSTPIHATPQTPMNITYNLFGTSSRININSSDSSFNVVDQTLPEVFEQLLSEIRRNISDTDSKQQIETAVKDMKSNYGKSGFLSSYQSFISVVADHMQVFGPIVAPFLPILTKLIS